MKPTRIHISLPVFQSNRKHGTDKPCLIVNAKANTYGHTVDIAGGRVQARFDMSSACKLWVTTSEAVTLYDYEGETIATIDSGAAFTVSRSAILNNKGYQKGRGKPAVRQMAATLEPVLTVTSKQGVYKAYSAQLGDVARFEYSPLKPLSCGAKVYIETEAEVKAS